eukprot:jgi/Hompol1/6557/HPOL_000747-RA
MHAGGFCSENGVTKQVRMLSYEAYTPMAVKEMRHIACEARSTFKSILKLALVHRIGDVGVGEASIAVVVSSPHRRDALDAVSWIMDEVKARVPVWKQEIYADGTCWKENAEWRSLHLQRQHNPQQPEIKLPSGPLDQQPPAPPQDQPAKYGRMLIVLGNGSFSHNSRGHAPTPSAKRVFDELTKLGETRVSKPHVDRPRDPTNTSHSSSQMPSGLDAILTAAFQPDMVLSSSPATSSSMPSARGPQAPARSMPTHNQTYSGATSTSANIHNMHFETSASFDSQATTNGTVHTSISSAAPQQPSKQLLAQPLPQLRSLTASQSTQATTASPSTLPHHQPQQHLPAQMQRQQSDGFSPADALLAIYTSPTQKELSFYSSSVAELSPAAAPSHSQHSHA